MKICVFILDDHIPIHGTELFGWRRLLRARSNAAGNPIELLAAARMRKKGLADDERELPPFAEGRRLWFFA
jgi:hypothetical protein